MKKWFFLIFFIVLIAVLLVAETINLEPESEMKTKLRFNSTSACLKESCFKISIADSPEEREKGLMFIDKMPEDEGMLFIFEEEDLHRFWMKNTLIPLDIIWFDKSGDITSVKKDAEPCKAEPCPVFVPDKPSLYALEIKSGLTNKLNISNNY